MKTNDNNTPQFSARTAWLGFIAYFIFALIIILTFFY